MSRIIALARLRMPQVQSTDAAGKFCPLLRQHLILARQTNQPDASQPVTIATSADINSKATFLHRVISLRPRLSGPVNTHSTNIVERLSGKAMARTGLRMMPTFPLPPLKFRTAGFPRYGFKAGLSDGAFPAGWFAIVLRALCCHR